MELEPSAGKRDICKVMASLMSTLPFSVIPEIKEYLFLKVHETLFGQ